MLHPLPPTLRTHVLAALRAWHDATGTPQNWLADLQLVQDARAQLNAQNLEQYRQATNAVLAQALTVLDQQAPSAARLLRERYIQRLSIEQLAQRLNITLDAFTARQRGAVAVLADALWLLELAAQAPD